MSHILFLNWRDTRNPEGGGSEVYTERIAAELVTRGHRVTLLCAAYQGAPAEQVLPTGVSVLRRGGRHTVYLRAALTYLAAGARDRPDLIVDVCNGVPFLSPLYARCPTVVVVHHVHREQWPVVFGDWRGRFGWWLESWVAPRVYRRCRYVTVSTATRDELVRLGVAASRISIIQNGLSSGGGPAAGRSGYPCLVVLGRLVPHKRVEYAMDALAALTPHLPGLRLVVAGRGWWEPRLREYSARLGVEARVDFAGYVSEGRKHELLSYAWVVLVPSLKEGWGLTILEAAARGTPAIAFRAAGGVCDAIRDGRTGLLADDPDDFVAKAGWLLADEAARRRMGTAARAYAETFSWAAAGEQLAALVDEGVSGSRRRSAARSDRRPGRPSGSPRRRRSD
ncbi:Glycosyltransferase involved in cell wall bisynthesis [Actinoplanes regularis]|uniref:Glycosyltransferase involved in cell wall bisynthesis n=1 Tax=Actinoplanes regularis TaxID=52697 RepID=A0A238Z4X9_9ACTN|nr:glycosyltransferase family 4 protein [Actinoplanes regularis]GIE85818.1 putative glycosyl transferase [Actinoplanes regularis]SNR78242.1 Glycosyltransferase involved in cell wall bisynthesis [Actinoplanes regularis]